MSELSAAQPSDREPPAPRGESRLRDWKQRDIVLLRKTLSMLCHFVWHRQLRPGEHLWSIPVDEERDFDCILSDAISELQHLRASARPVERPPQWQPIQRYDLTPNYRCGGVIDEMEPHDYGDWVRYDDVKAFLPAPPDGSER